MKIKSETIMVSLLKAGFAVPFMLVLSACDDSGSAANSEVLDNSSTSLYDEAQGKGEETDKRIEDGDRKSSSSIQKEEYSSSSEKEEYDFDGEVVFAYELPSCTVKKDEKTYYVRDEDAAYTCDYDDFFRKGEWIKENGLGEDDDWIYSSSSENAFVDCDGKVNSVYELQLQAVNAQIEAQKNAAAAAKEAAEAQVAFANGAKQLQKQVADLNGIYGNMLNALA